MDMTDLPGRRVPDAPQLRTLLLTDLCDSTTLVERLGDGPAAELFREHDRLVLKLQQQWRGRLIDRSDGLLLLFERPIDGLGFALDYVRGLREISQREPFVSRKLPIKARAGLHVGEVLTWRNSDEAVKVGAKPLEVEGLAKPMAGRLMAMARPGQVLISAVAEPLAHRAARELGERGQHLLWKSHGRWRFKGVPESQQIYEVGEPGIAPLRMPPASAKAWRDLPLWRRPAALAAEVAVLAGLAGGAWFVTRPQPAIAFHERDWVVVGDLRNLTGQKLLDDSLEQAFRISLEQSRYVNVLSDLKTRDTLARMQRPAGTALDRAIASEIALRDGARAVILPTVAEIGGRLRVSAEVIDPHTQTTVYAESADGQGAASALASIDEVTASLREKLGEALAAIESDSKPLPQVTTGNLDALRAYALGQASYASGKHQEALQLYERSTQLDPNFALAWLGQVRVQYSNVNAPGAIVPLRRAQGLRERLASREALYLDAWGAEFDSPADAIGKWVELAKLYPDFWAAQGNAALAFYTRNNFQEAVVYAKRNTAPQNELSAMGWDWLGRAQLGMEQYPDAVKSVETALRHGYKSSLRRKVAILAAQRDFAAAGRFLDDLSPNDRHAYIERTSVALDLGKWRDAVATSQTGLTMARHQGGFDSRAMLLPIAVSTWLAGDTAAATRYCATAVNQALDALSAVENADAVEDAELALSASILMVRLGDRSLADRVLAVVDRQEKVSAIPSVVELAVVLRAEQLKLASDPESAVKLLEPLLAGHERFQTRVALMGAYLDANQHAAALEQARWVRSRRGLAYIELECGYCLQALNVVDSNAAMLAEAQALAGLGRAGDSARALQDFDRYWPVEILPAHLRVKRDEVTAVSN